MLARVPFTNLTREIIAAAIEVHRVLGPGLLESAYSTCLQHELSTRRLAFVTQRRVPLVYKGITAGLRVSPRFAGGWAVVVEVKALADVLPIHQAQLLTYLRLTGFTGWPFDQLQVERLVDGVKRVINAQSSAMKSAAVRLAADGGLP